MKRTIYSIALAGLLFVGCTQRTQPINVAEHSESPAQKSGSSQSKAAVPKTIVSIELAGLMVLHEERTRPGYEVGILPADAHQHQFKFVFDHQEISLTSSDSWTLDVVNDPPVPGTVLVPPRAIGHTGRRPDDPSGYEDFDWIVDLDGREFNSDLPAMKEGVLKPIIHLPNLELFTATKSIDLQRCQGGGGCQDSPGGGVGSRTDFGFISESSGMNVELNPRQKLILTNSATGSIQTLVQYPSPGKHVVRISNVRFPQDDKSDFHLYYDLLFPTFDASKRFDFDKKAPPFEVSYNPSAISRTCCQMDCTAIRLVNRVDPLR